MPIFTKGRDPKKIQATNLYIYSSSNISVALMREQEETPFVEGTVSKDIKSFEIDNLPIGSWKMRIQNTKEQPEKLWLIVRYTLKK